MKSDFIVILFYKFINIPNPEALAREHREMCQKLGLKGRMIIAEEGVNATFEGKKENIEKYKEFLKKGMRFSDVVIKESEGNGKAFPKLKIKIRDEIVKLGAGKIDVEKETAESVTADELERWYKDNESWWRSIKEKSEEFKKYYEKAYANRG